MCRLNESGLTHNDYVRMSIDAGVAPLELIFYPITDCESGYPIAYRTRTVIHSIILGDLKEDDYLYVSDPRTCGVELLKHNLQHAIGAIKKFDAKERNVGFISVHCPSEIVENNNLYEIVSEVLKKNPSIAPQRLCLEFSASLFDKDADRARAAILDMKLLKVRTSLIGCGTEEFPIAKMLRVPPDIVILDPSVTAYAGSRDKPMLLSSLVSYIRSMNVDAIAEGTEEQRKMMRGTECVGFIETEAEGLNIEDAIAQKEADD